MSNYRTINLLERKINCGTITEDEFVNTLSKDLKNADAEYVRLYGAEIVHSTLTCCESLREEAKVYAEAKWKTRKRRDAFMEKTEYAIKDYYNKLTERPCSLSYFDFKVCSSTNSISSVCILDIDASSENLKNCFNEIKNNKYFQVAKGWSLQYEAPDDSYRSAFRPQIKLILDKEHEMMFNNEAKKLCQDIEDFYKETKYYGD